MEWLRCLQLLGLAAVCWVVAQGEAGAASPKTGVWRGEITLRASSYNADGAGYRWRFRAVFPGRWVPGSSRTRWKGTLSWTFEGHIARGDPRACTYDGFGTWPVLLEIYEKLHDSGREQLAVDFYEEPWTKFGPIRGVLAERCPGYPSNELKGRDMMYWLPRLGEMPTIHLKKTTKSFVRIIRPLVLEVFGYQNKRFPVRLAFVKKPT